MMYQLLKPRVSIAALFLLLVSFAAGFWLLVDIRSDLVDRQDSKLAETKKEPDVHAVVTNPNSQRVNVRVARDHISLISKIRCDSSFFAEHAVALNELGYSDAAELDVAPGLFVLEANEIPKSIRDIRNIPDMASLLYFRAKMLSSTSDSLSLDGDGYVLYCGENEAWSSHTGNPIGNWDVFGIRALKCADGHLNVQLLARFEKARGSEFDNGHWLAIVWCDKWIRGDKHPSLTAATFVVEPVQELGLELALEDQNLALPKPFAIPVQD